MKKGQPLAALHIIVAGLAALSCSMPVGDIENPAVAVRHDHQPPRTTVRRRAARRVPDVVLSPESAAAEVSFDNAPFDPTTSSNPDEVLDMPRPIATTYLMALAPPLESPGQHGGEIGEAEASAEHYWHVYPASATCHSSQFARDHNARLVVFLAVVFFMVVFAMEAWRGIYDKARRTITRQGAIRLREEKAGYGYGHGYRHDRNKSWEIKEKSMHSFHGT